MASNNDIVIPIFDEDGNPRPDLEPEFLNFKNLTTNTAATPPDITEDEDVIGVYHVPRTAPVDGHMVGMMDFGIGSYPRYELYDVRYEDLLTGPYVQFTSGGIVGPTIVGVVASPQHILISFSRPMRMTTDSSGALNLSNYSVPGLTLLAVVALDTSTVSITTSPQTTNQTYALTVDNVTDANGNPLN